MNTVMPHRIIVYARVSTNGQEENGASLEAQQATCLEECAKRGWDVLEVICEVASGRDVARPELQRALARLEQGEADGLIVAKLDRLSRSLMDFAGIVERSRRGGWTLLCLDANVDTSSPAGEALVSVMAVFAQLERRLIGQRTREALAVKRSQGVRLGRPPVLSDSVRAQIRQARADGESYRSIADWLTESGVPTAQNGRRWYASTVRAAELVEIA